METKNIIISIVAGLLVLGVGFLGGMLFNGVVNPKTVTQPQDTSTAVPQIVKDLSSKVIPSIAAYGKVAKINGKNITLSYQGDSVTILVRDDAKVYSFISGSTDPKLKTTAPGSKEINFTDIKVGDDVSVNTKVLITGRLEGFSIVVLPPVTPVGK